MSVAAPAVAVAPAPAVVPAIAPVVARADRSGWSPAGDPVGVVRARDVDEVCATLAYASAHGIPVVTRGAASGLAGAASAGEGAIVLDVSGLDRILSIDPVDGVARVEPGVITADLDRAAARHGLLYAPDPGSVEISTIGGNIATNAGGLRGAKYGVTRDAVLALDVVLADGSLVHLGRDTVKGVVGLDLTALVVGSEGASASSSARPSASCRAPASPRPPRRSSPMSPRGPRPPSPSRSPGSVRACSSWSTTAPSRRSTPCAAPTSRSAEARSSSCRPTGSARRTRSRPCGRCWRRPRPASRRLSMRRRGSPWRPRAATPCPPSRRGGGS
ncbi:FAD-binding protein [Rathayibacter oskolensis]|nr:FAD-binding protein [Rathayibacter oskolensis]WKK71121.1 FAD-binding protein [Rathayibacter oskolensis]